VKAAAWILLLGAIMFSGCKTAHDVAVSSFRVIDAPANYVRKKIEGPSETQTTTTSTTVSSDAVTTPGRTITPTDRDAQRRKVTTENQPRPNATSTPAPRVTTSKPSPSPSPRTPATQTAQYPTAKPVPGKPGYVFSPFDPSGGYVDVNGYTSGQKVKDPYSGKIFLVP
jgi:cell division septation protein DedD